jgi:CRP-like cAMP-binding protein
LIGAASDCSPFFDALGCDGSTLVRDQDALKFGDGPADVTSEAMTYLLQNVRLFEAFSATERVDLVHFMHEKQFEAGTTVCTRGENGNTMLVVVQGALSAVVPAKDNPRHEVARLEAGAVIGEMFCIDPAPRPVTIVARESTVVLELGRDDLTKMRQEIPGAAAALVSAVFHEALRRLRSVDDRIDRERHDANFDDKTPRPTSDVPPNWEACFAHLRGSA